MTDLNAALGPRPRAPAKAVHTTTRAGVPEQTIADFAAAELLDHITAEIVGHPRSAQKLIGPSEIGIPCSRALLYKLAQVDEPPRGPAWKPTVGTALHAWMEGIFGRPDMYADGWRVEERLDVGTIGPHVISGSCDLYVGGIVVDWKFVGPSRLKTYKSKGPGDQYRTQAHTYGKGWQDRGEAVDVVMIAFLPRDGELRDAYFWWEPYDRKVAEAGLARANAAYRLIEVMGLEGALSLYEECDDRWCPWCKTGTVLTGGPEDLNNVL